MRRNGFLVHFLLAVRQTEYPDIHEVPQSVANLCMLATAACMTQQY